MSSFEVHFLEVVKVVESERVMTGEDFDIVCGIVCRSRKKNEEFLVEWQLAWTMTRCIREISAHTVYTMCVTESYLESV